MPHLKISVAIKALIFLQILQSELCSGSVDQSKAAVGSGGLPPDESLRAKAPADTESWLNERYPDLMTPLKSLVNSGDARSQCSMTSSGQLCRFDSSSGAAVSSVWRGYSDRSICCETSPGDCRGWGKRCQMQKRPQWFLMCRFPVTQPWHLWWAATTGQLRFRTVWVDSYCKCMRSYSPYVPSPVA
ncbi:hypothetical protein CAPTEDRAFT_210870 [Capitella teleta]|uniref:Spaetzle domain-containing protein n=1 Tax=Capitella teleta TaxID=283909 RepID=R7TZ00_CAPTE|nr:hypothetical protein CAPTEDRAFT_210870 [Capitella teleta]|eukprot:ELT98827.1 hypothetical protein CAPTEDRAFT_210870 [Capitella teleta]